MIQEIGREFRRFVFEFRQSGHRFDPTIVERNRQAADAFSIAASHRMRPRKLASRLSTTPGEDGSKIDSKQEILMDEANGVASPGDPTGQKLAAAVVVKFHFRQKYGCSALAEGKEPVRIPVLISAAKQSITAEDRKRIASAHRHRPNRFDAAPAQTNEGEIGVIIEPDILIGCDIQRIAVANRVEAGSRFEFAGLDPELVKSDKARCSDRIVPAIIAEYSFVEVTRPDHALGCRLYVLDSVTEQDFPHELPFERIDTTVLFEIVATSAKGTGTNQQQPVRQRLNFVDIEPFACDSKIDDDFITGQCHDTVILGLIRNCLDEAGTARLFESIIERLQSNDKIRHSIRADIESDEFARTDKRSERDNWR